MDRQIFLDFYEWESFVFNLYESIPVLK